MNSNYKYLKMKIVVETAVEFVFGINIMNKQKNLIKRNRIYELKTNYIIKLIIYFINGVHT